MTNLIKTSGWPVKLDDLSSCPGFKPSKFKWHYGECNDSDVMVYCDLNHMGGFSNTGSGLNFLVHNFSNYIDKLKFLVHGFEKNRNRLKFLKDGFGENKNRLKFLWLCESKEITHKAYNHMLENVDLFFDFYNAIFVHDRELIEKESRFIYVPNASNKHWIIDCGIHKKTKLVSMFNSGKRMCNGHLLRNKIALKFKNKIDLFGITRPVARKEEGLNDYMFSITLENAQYKTYITEKLMDCFATGTVPVYWGAPDVGDYFNEDGIITLTEDFEIEQLNEDLYYSKMDAIKDNYKRCMNVVSADDQLYEEVTKYL